MMYVKDDQFRIYKIDCKTLDEAIDLIHRYENHIYDLYGGDTWSDMDTWGWWDYRKYEVVDYDSLDEDDEIFDLVDYEFDYPQQFCKSYCKGDLNENK